MPRHLPGAHYRGLCFPLYLSTDSMLLCGGDDFFCNLGSNLGLRSSAVYKAPHHWLEKEVSQREEALLAKCSHCCLSYMTGMETSHQLCFPQELLPFRDTFSAHHEMHPPGDTCALCLGSGLHSSFGRSHQYPDTPDPELLICWGQL